ncbi:hypothetical protein ACFL3F_01540, partial [Planctomycetota bacterium]
MRRISIREGNTGILDITAPDGERKRYVPDCDLRESNRLLQQFYTLRSSDGKAIKDCYWKDGINWFPTTTALLHWHVLYMYVKYRAFMHEYPTDKYEYVFLNRRRLADFVSLLLSQEKDIQRSTIGLIKRSTNRVKCFLAHMHNRIVFRICPGITVLFMRYGSTDFRTRHAKEVLAELGVKCVEIGKLGILELVRSITRENARPKLLSCRKTSCKKCVPIEFPQTSDYILDRVLRTAVFAIENKIHAFQETYEFLKETLRTSPIQKMYGIDDTNNFYPAIYACRENGIKTIGHQHGTNFKTVWEPAY